MKAEELRIGNYVRCTEGNTICINKDDMIYILSNTFDVEPIPLSEEVLLKCGFEKCGELFTIRDVINNEFDIFCYEDDFEIKIENDYCCYQTMNHIKYLHQLQNLVYSLTGEELEVKWS